MNVPAYIEQAPWALVALVVCMTFLVIGSAAGVVAVARLTACTAIEAAHALATVLGAFRGRAPETTSRARLRTKRIRDRNDDGIAPSAGEVIRVVDAGS